MVLNRNNRLFSTNEFYSIKLWKLKNPEILGILKELYQCSYIIIRVLAQSNHLISKRYQKLKNVLRIFKGPSRQKGIPRLENIFTKILSELEHNFYWSEEGRKINKGKIVTFYGIFSWKFGPTPGPII